MIDLLTIEESLADKPSFRRVLEDHEKEVNDLENILEKVSKGCKTFCDTGKAFCDSMGPFTEGISDLARHFHSDDELKDAYQTFSEHLEEINSFYSMLLEQAKRSILLSMIEDMKKMLKDVKLHRKAFREKSDELDTALNTNSAKIPRKKDDEQDAISCLQTLSATKAEFHHTSVDYVYEINKLQLGKQYLVTDKFLHLMYSFYSFFHQGYLTLQHIDPYLKNLNALMQQKQSQREESIKKLDTRHKAVAQLKNNEYEGLMITPKDNTVLLEGYLYKRSHNTFRTWKRRYFIIKNNQLHCQKRSKGTKEEREESTKVLSEDLRITQVRSTEEQDRRYCFELIMPSKKIFLQADSQKVKDAWIKSLQCGIEAAIHNTTSTNENTTQKTSGIPTDNMKSGNSLEILKLLSDIKKMAGNETCADCDNREPVWASINLGVTLCITCSGIHRNLGVHISKVRSIELDIWEVEQCMLMLKLGNSRVNQIYEHCVVEPHLKPGDSTSSLATNEVYIRAKYDDKLFIQNRDFVIKQKQRHSVAVAPSYRTDSISYDPSTVTHSQSLKARMKRGDHVRPLSKLFQNMHRKKRGGSDGTGYIETDPVADEEDRALSPQYALLGTEEPTVEDVTHSEMCVPDNLLSNTPLSCSSPNLPSDFNKEGIVANSGLNQNLIGQLALNNNLFESCGDADVITMFRCLVEGADINYRNSTAGDSTPLIQAIKSNSRDGLQLLLMNGADVNQLDESRQAALHHAAGLGYTDLACLLLKKCADHRQVNKDNKDPLDIAIEGERASLVTVLRFIRINETSDPTSQQLLNEFSKTSSIDR